MANEPTQETLVFRDRSAATIDVTHLGSDRFRIDDPLIAVAFPALQFHDIIKATRDTEGNLVVQRRIEKSGFHAYEYVLSEGWHERESVQGVLDKVRSLGGQWCGVFGGILIICLPSASDYDPSEDIALAMSAGPG